MSDALMMPVLSATENPRLEFRDGQFLFAMTNLEGGKCERFISAAAAREAFSGIPVDSGWLKPEIVRWGNGKLGEWAVAFIPPGLHTLELTNETIVTGEDLRVDHQMDRLTVPLPGLVFFGIGTNYYIWAVKTPQLKPDYEIYRCPLPNVEADGLICWGPFKPPRASPRAILEAFDLFIKSTFNNHRANGKSKRQKEDVRLMLRDSALPFPTADGMAFSILNGALDGRPISYPIDDLVRQVPHVGASLDKAIREFFETGEMPS